MFGKLTKLALTSRLVILVLQLLANMALPDHEPDVFRAPVVQATNATTPSWLERSINYCFGGLRHWDGEYFLHIAEHGYTYEQTLAFYPLYPLLVRGGAEGLHYLGLGSVSLRSCCLLVGVLLNLFCFCRAANTLYTLTQHVFNDTHKSWNAALLFCCNPASIFYSAAYSETLFCWCTLQLMLECVRELRCARVSTALALGIVCRSNGLVNAGYPAYFMLRRWLLRRTNQLFAFGQLLLCLLTALLPLTVYYFYAFKLYCQTSPLATPHDAAVKAYGIAQNYVLAGPRQPHNSPWCDRSFPFPYSYIQSHYWHVGLLRYYQLRQLPNFALAAPLLGFLYLHCGHYLRQCWRLVQLGRLTLMQLLKEYKSLPFIVHALFLTVFCTLFVHIQVSTRLLCSATPCVYWFAADYMPRSFDKLRLRSKAGGILMWFSGYYVVGTVLFANNLPWT